VKSITGYYLTSNPVNLGNHSRRLDSPPARCARPTNIVTQKSIDELPTTSRSHFDPRWQLLLCFRASGTPRTLREPSSTPMSNLPPAPFAKATRVRITLSGEERSRLNSKVFPSCWRMISVRSNMLRNLLGSAPMWQASELAPSQVGLRVQFAFWPRPGLCGGGSSRAW
jgi:hypothetical protein